ncbi:glycoside hydrolase family 2 TIM barrel-domain containing protein [Prevotella sp. lc2012]|uniref:glycoside hydrolase family 2 TIM barrel-domain containing protein n=1 Tax=Prevotella sp. lc2012 TaxID=1761886 RepID=UPI00089BB67A|nr:glycoside hydrolase family 2 TIM barrel-domain containing protein [Prevotella sp. lc2012]SEE43857.1 beta-galactosidase [Prevotella sp. lc2012]
MRRLFCLVCVLCGLTTIQARQRQIFDADWLFLLADSVQMSEVDYDDSAWRHLNVPHDWAIEGDFYVGNPSGASGGALPGGIGWYRKHFQISTDPSPKGSRFFLEFDGVYMNSTVYVNGQEVGFRPYGYSTFEYDITPYVHQGENVVAVRVDNSDQPNSRWYSGCGIYRHVWLTQTHPVHVKHWGVYADARVVKGKGRLDIGVSLDGAGTVENTLLDSNGRVVGRSRGLRSTITVTKPLLWSCDAPNTYKVRTEVKVRGKVVDIYETTTGFRDFRFDPQTGFWLNGKNFKLNGVCEHHDFGCLGAALNEDALHRKLTKLKAMGVNAIRSSHNPPTPELLNMCDTMGLIVMDESFDMWRRRKTQNDYARFFDEWHERDLSDLVMRDRNHPSILMWSIGNEVLEQWSSAEADTLTLEQANLILNAGHDESTLAKDGELSVQSLLTQHLAEIVKRYDTSRPITAGCNEPSPNNHLFKSGAIDIIGFNYHHQWVRDVPQNFPGKPFIFSESVSALQTRGNYMMPSDSVYVAPKEWWLPYTDPSYMCSAYDNMHASWSSTHEETWDVVKHTPYVGGQFIWTGFDYIGEPTPYGFPARSSYFGLIDLAGFPKDTYYMYQSEWTTKPVLHLFPHWNWVPGDEIDMWCYYNNADEVELFVNGKSQGVKRKTASKDDPLCTAYHVGWRVTFDPGEVKAVSRKDGKVVCEQIIKTAGAPDHIRLSVDYQGQSTIFIMAEVVDRDGNLCPWAEDQICFIYEGDGEVLGTDNGCQTSMDRFRVVPSVDGRLPTPHRKAFFGKCMVVATGNGSITAKSATLQPGVVTFTVGNKI